MERDIKIESLRHGLVQVFQKDALDQTHWVILDRQEIEEIIKALEESEDTK